ncbi:translation initiation factor IF-2 [Patescibacteria group bacterium]|nr:translation initiation factor IF-2 [Patescibacteria group bacterium]
MATEVQLEETITVGSLAERLMIPVSTLIAELMKNGVMVTVNERIDFDTAQIIIQELGLDVELKPSGNYLERPKREKPQAGARAELRPPVVAVMGHVDHGKTSLLDAIRGSAVAAKESGGITQHISAYQITHNNRPITFLDTPGHEAFAAIREHGAQLTDIVVLVVAADDGVKPQTLEAIRYAKNAGVKIIVAINKVDKPEADVNRIKQQLAEANLLVEEWGGDTVVVEVSAKTGKGISELLDMVLLVADVEELKADRDIPARGLVIEAHVEIGRGPVAQVLIEAGEIRRGQFVVAGSTYAKVRNLESTDGRPLAQAGPSTPVTITGFKTLPEFGDEFKVVASERMARSEAESTIKGQSAQLNRGVSSSELLRIINRSNELKEMNIIIKADVQGSLTSVIDSLKALDTDEVSVRIVSSGVGAITDNDLRLSQAAGAKIYGFNVSAPSAIRQQAVRDRIELHLYNVIYELIDDIKRELELLLTPEVVETDTGTLIVRGIFNSTKTKVICGGEVTKGRLVVPAFARIIRDKQQLMEAEVTNLKRGPTDVKEVLEGEMCGISLATPAKLDLQLGDRLEVFTREVKQRHL